jgi:hypothetical protein
MWSLSLPSSPGFPSKAFLESLCSSILQTCPSHLNHKVLITVAAIKPHTFQILIVLIHNESFLSFKLYFQQNIIVKLASWTVINNCMRLLRGSTILEKTLASLRTEDFLILLFTFTLVGFLWTSDQPVAKASAYTGKRNTEKREQTSMF